MEEIVGILIPVTYFGLLALERVFPARPLPKVKRWTLRGLAFFLVTMAISGLIPALLTALVGDWSPVGLARLGTVGGAVAAFLVADLLSYAMHRSFHEVHLLWRWVHQLHHSAERLDVLGAAYTHPMEILVPGLITSVATLALGVTPDAAALAGFFAVFNAIFQHTNIKTPQWLGYIVQRPESHSVHHGRGVHAYNYANFPLIDLVFGTFRNPAGFSAVQGFWDGASSELGAMLLGKDVAAAPPETSAPVVTGMAASS